MLQSKARWKIQQNIGETAERLATELQIPLLLAKLLAGRGIDSKERAERFLTCEQDQSDDPFLLGGMAEAVERIRGSLDNQEKIRIYGDYDADGVSSTSLMICLLRHLKADFDYYIPHRINEGYGLHAAALEQAAKSGISLIITVDTGISALEQIEVANSLGIDVIVTDHHEPSEQLPAAYAVINPKKPGDAYPFKGLAGVGVALKLAQALIGNVPESWYELAAIGTIADLMPLTDENRLIVSKGLLQMRNSAFPGLRALFGLAGIDGKAVNAAHVGFAVAPRINAGGRLENADIAVKLLTTDNEQEAEQLGFDLDQLNKERQRIVEDMAKQAFAQIERDRSEAQHVLVIAGENWNSGVIGIVASRIMDKYFKPVIVLSIDPQTGEAKGSARSIPAFNIYRALTDSRELLEHYGGHQAAAGMTLKRENIKLLRERLNLLAAQWLVEDDFMPVMEIDLECGLHEVTLEAVEQIERLGPFGMANPLPRFVIRGTKIHELKTIGREKQHLKLALGTEDFQNGQIKEALAFGRGDLADLISSTSTLEIVGEMSVNEWNGVRKPQIIIQDISIPHLQVFDWRNIKESGVQRISQLLQKLKEVDAQAGAHAVLLFDDSSIRVLPQSFVDSEHALWTIDRQGEFHPANGAARDAGLGRITSLLLYTLPGSLSQIEQALLQLPRVSGIYALFADAAGSGAAHPPSRETLKKIYVSLLQLKRWRHDQHGALEALSRKTGLSAAMIKTSLEIFEQLAFIERQGAFMQCVEQPGKKDLQESPLYRDSLARAEVEKVFVYSTAAELADWFWKLKDSEQFNPLKTEEVV